MKKRILSILLTLCMVLCLVPTAVFAEGSPDITGTGTADDPYLIYTAQGLKAFRDKVNGQYGLTKQPGAHATLMNDIVLNNGIFDEDGSWSESGTPQPWTPIGTDTNPYTGTFDGGGHTIKGLYVNVNGENSAGLFGYTDGATIKNVTVDGYVSISGNFSNNGGTANVAGIVACAMNTSIADCTNLCTVKSDSSAISGIFAGGIVGNMHITKFTAGKTEYSITNCRNDGKVIRIANDNSEFWIGGIAGEASVPVSGCYNTGSITANCSITKYASSSVGGVVGVLGEGVVLNGCYNTGAVTVEGDFTVESEIAFSVGGIAGTCRMDNTISSCYNVGKVTYTGNCEQVNSGGIVGINAISTVTDCYYLTGTAEKAVGLEYLSITTERAEAKSKAAFADGTVLNLLKQNDTTGAWGECGYLAAVGMTLPLLSWQTADAHTHDYQWKYDNTEHRKECCCGSIEAGSTAAHSGTATCKEQAVCDVCGEKYGIANPNNHSYEWQNENGRYWQKCKLCGFETDKKLVPTIVFTGSDKVCRSQDYKFSFTPPEGATDAEWGYEFINLAGGPITPTLENGRYYGVMDSDYYSKSENSFKLIMSAKTADGFEFRTEKIVTIPDDHTGGTVTCTEQAVCEVCGESYGELNANNHADMKHIEAKAATKTDEGNIEYWYCKGCGKYFADKDGIKEIAKADTVTAKLPEEKPASPKTGDTSNLALWLALLFVSGGAVTATTVIGKKKRHS